MALPRKSKKQERSEAKDYTQDRSNNENQQKRKNAADLESISNKLDGPVMMDNELYLSSRDRLELMLLQERLQHSETKCRKSRSDLDRHEAQYLYQRARLAEMASGSEIERAKAEAILIKYHKDIERAYGVKITEITFDTETGLIKRNE